MHTFRATSATSMPSKVLQTISTSQTGIRQTTLGMENYNTYHFPKSLISAVAAMLMNTDGYLWSSKRQEKERWPPGFHSSISTLHNPIEPHSLSISVILIFTINIDRFCSIKGILNSWYMLLHIPRVYTIIQLIKLYNSSNALENRQYWIHVWSVVDFIYLLKYCQFFQPTANHTIPIAWTKLISFESSILSFEA